MAAKKNVTLATVAASDAEPRDFVFMGLREVIGNKTCSMIAVIDDNGKLKRPQFFIEKTLATKCVGGVYSGVSFTDTSAVGLQQSKFKRSWSQKDDVLAWQAEHDSAKIADRIRKDEANAKQTDELEYRMRLPRMAYTKLKRRGDWVACAALEAAVMRALRQPLNEGD